MMSTLMSCGRSNSLPVKIAAERCLFYALRIGVNSNAFLQEYVKGDGVDSKKVLDYSKRVLVKLESADSEGE
jgi:hypothetical protein